MLALSRGGDFPRKTARSTLTFLEQVVDEMPFSIQRIQTDRGQEFFACVAQDRLRDWRIKVRPIRRRSPHLSGKVERAQKTTLEEFWPTVPLDAPDIEDRLAEWRHFYNWRRPHDSLDGHAPIDRVSDRSNHAPLGEDIARDYDPNAEFILQRNGWPNQRPQ